MSSIFSIVYLPEDRHYPDRLGEYIRVPVQNAILVAGHGIQGDQKAGKHPDRQ